MSRNLPKKTGECVYCGDVGSITYDHIPPKSLFAKPKPQNLVTVPSCLACNGGASDDDEYFRLLCTARHDTHDHPDAKAGWSTAFRGLTKPRKVLFKNAFLETCREVAVHTDAGVYLGQTLSFEADLRRLSRVVRRTVIGLFYHHTGSRLRDGYEAIAFAVEGLAGTPGLADLEREIILPLWKVVPNTIGQDVFTYRFQILEEDSNASAWFMSVYQAIHFVGLTMPGEMAGTVSA